MTLKEGDKDAGSDLDVVARPLQFHCSFINRNRGRRLEILFRDENVILEYYYFLFIKDSSLFHDVHSRKAKSLNNLCKFSRGMGSFDLERERMSR